jgi:hypothetical protein
MNLVGTNALDKFSPAENLLEVVSVSLRRLNPGSIAQSLLPETHARHHRPTKRDCTFFFSKASEMI